MHVPFLETLARRFKRRQPPAGEQRPRTAADAEHYPWENAYPAGVAWRVEVEPRPLPALLDDAAAEFPDNVCINFRGKRYAYKEIAKLVNRAAKGFRGLGVQRGINVALLLPNSPYAVICFYAILKAGGTVVNINPLYSKEEIARHVADANACFLVTLDMNVLYDKVSDLPAANPRLEKIVVCSLAEALPFGEKALFSIFKRSEVADIPRNDRHILCDDLIDNDGEFEPDFIDPRTDVAVMQFTGGTTGISKAARLTHANLYANAEQLAMWAPTIEHGQERILGVLPLFHAFGMTVIMNMGFRIGAQMILLPHFKTAEVLQTIEREKPTVFVGVPTMYSAINGFEELNDYDLSSLEICISGGASLPAEVCRRFEEITGCALLEGYGLSETSPVCTVNPLHGVRKPGSVGLPLPGTIVNIVSLDDPGKLMPTGEPGEICIAGPQVMAGYANRAQENVHVFRGGHFHTGDVGYLDHDGYLFIIDRIKEIIISGGFNIYPRNVEEALHRHPAVEEVAVCGVPDDHRGETVKAFIKLRDGTTVTARELQDYLADKLAPFELPREFEFRESLPKTLIGKISKKDLVSRPSAGTDGHSPTRSAG
ncbi:MAG TPA: long-chain fatty acid--CoA ligase [Rhodospirillales bacterium]